MWPAFEDKAPANLQIYKITYQNYVYFQIGIFAQTEATNLFVTTSCNSTCRSKPMQAQMNLNFSEVCFPET